MNERQGKGVSKGKGDMSERRDKRYRKEEKEEEEEEETKESKERIGNLRMSYGWVC